MNPLFDPRWRRAVDLSHASRLLNHGPTVMIGARHGSRRNLMSAAWSMPVEFTPPRIAIVIDKSTWTRELVIASGILSIMVPCRASADLCFTVGSVTGKALAVEGDDKFARYDIANFDGPALGLPLATECIGWLECRLLRSLDEAPAELRTLHYIAAGVFAVASETQHAALLPHQPRG